MRYIGITFVATLIASAGGTAAAQQTVSIQLDEAGVSVSAAGDSTGTMVFSGGMGPAGQTAMALATVNLTQPQRDSIAKLGKARGAAIAAADARYAESIRGVLTQQQRTQFDANVAKAKAQEKQMLETVQKMQQQMLGRGKTILQGSVGDDEALKSLDEPDDDAAGDAADRAKTR